MRYSDAIRSEQELEELLSTPSPALIEMMKRLDGDPDDSRHRREGWA